eukprot:544357-Pelagomonas_calceolata.AAC.1
MSQGLLVSQWHGSQSSHPVSAVSATLSAHFLSRPARAIPLGLSLWLANRESALHFALEKRKGSLCKPGPAACIKERFLNWQAS